MLDHLVYAVRDLEQGMDAIEQLLGVRPAPGGKHQGRGTHNALLSLGDGPYLEVIAPDPDQPRPSGPMPFGLDRPGARDRLATWAAKAPAIEERVAKAKGAGYDPGEIRAMSRDLPGDAGRLEWKLTQRQDGPGDGLVPFLIDWGASPHPSATSPGGARFVSLRAEHPDPDAIRAMLGALGLEIAVTKADRPALIATIRGPKGEVELR